MFLRHTLWCAIAVPALVAQPVLAQGIQVTAVEVKPTDKGLEVVLQTPTGKAPQVFSFGYRNTFVANITNAQLALPQGNSFRQENPTQGITAVSVTQQGANSIRVTVIGKAGVPTAKVVTSKGALVLSLIAPAAPTAQKPTPPPEVPETVVPETVEPESQTQPEATTPETEGVTPQPTTPEQLPATAEGEEIEVLVTGEREGGYSVPNATTGTRTDTPLRDIPQSIQVIPQQVLEDQQVTQVEEALQNVSGVTFLGNNDSRGVEFSIRGFEDTPILRDGFRIYNFNQSFPETANLDRVEVLKGPASILFGEIQPGGVINLVSKKPLSEPFYEAQLQVGNRNFVRPRFDISGPLTSDGSLLYRLNALYQRSDSFRNYDEDNRRFFISPVLSWRIGKRTDLTVSLEHINDKRPGDFGTLAFNDGVVDVPRDRISNEPDDTVKSEYLSVGYNLEHRFNENWKLRNAFRYTSYEYDYNTLALPNSFDDETGIVTRFFASQDQQNQDYSLQTNVVGEFATGSIAHTLLFGVDFNHSNGDQVSSGFNRRLTLDIFNPVYRQIPKPDKDTLPIVQDDELEANRLGIYLQDQISLLENLKLLVGLRYDTVEQEIIRKAQSVFSQAGEQSQSDDALTPRVGIVYQPIEPVSLYASYSQSFNPNTETTASGDPLEPEKGEGYEVGVKAELLADKLFATLAYFDITKQNVAVADPDPAFLNAFIATGKQQSQGVELDVIGEILPGWNIIASYAYIDAEVSEDTDPDIVGSKLTGIPKNSASLWTTYEIQSGNLQGLGFGIGFNYVGERQGGLPNSFEVNSYFLTNAAIFYRRDNWQFALNFKNLFDVNYIEGVGSGRVRGIYPGDPFTVIGSVSVEF